jgi:CRISPR/Cas system-associated exonuclease Cas4 (RecB family)
MQISKTDFIHYLNCPKSLWLLKHRPDRYPYGEFSNYMKKLTAEGYEVEAYVQSLLRSQPDAASYSFQSVFQTQRGLYAKADVISDNGDGTINLYEVKSSTSVKNSGQHNQIQDAAFQKIVAEKAGLKIARVFIVHLNKDYVRQGDIDVEQLLVFADVTTDVAEIEAVTRAEIDGALELLAQRAIDEGSCSCLQLTKSNHCDSFSYFNPAIPTPSIYTLPRISKTMIASFVADGRFDLDEIGLDEVTDKQAPVLQSAHLKTPIIDQAAIARFFNKVAYPIYFIDYETYSSAIPLVDGARPQAPIPFQYSLHIKRTPEDTELLHVEYLAEEAAMPLAMIEHMQSHIRANGCLVSWHASFENTQNKTMAAQYPDKADFLNDLSSRTLDLEDVFKEGYVDIAFAGSTSIKKVLPVIAPDLTYSGLDVASGTDAMEAWIRLITMPNSVEKDQLREAMLEYCKLDTYAMIRIFEEMERV